jgi:hypothetical protein
MQKSMAEGEKKPRKMKRRYKILLWVLGVLLVVRIILPYVVLHYANKTLAEMDGYYGHVEDIDLNLYRGAYVINDIYLNQVDSVSGTQTPFFSCPKIDLSIEWGALFNGEIVGELIFEQPKLAFTKDKAEPAEVAADTTTFQQLLKDFMPLKVNRFEVNDGSIHYIDSTASPLVNIKMDKVHILALDLKNTTEKDEKLPSTVEAQANVYGGTMDFKMRLNVLEEQPAFDLNMELKNTDLVQLNAFLKAYGNFDVNSGNFGLYTEMAAEDGKFVGYVKPVIKDLDVVGPEDRGNSLLHKAWEALVGGVGELFENQKRDQVATKVELQGNFENPDINVPGAIWEVISNAFIQALMPALDNEISIRSVDTGIPEKEGLFDRVFDKEDGEKDDKKDKKDRKKEE